jgi:hypothetical protein
MARPENLVANMFIVVSLQYSTAAMLLHRGPSVSVPEQHQVQYVATAKRYKSMRERLRSAIP